jgi:predicted DsbA family dithiol-disulfide isomerase
MPALTITEFTDPGCPWAWSAEPFRRRLDWLYGDAIAWRLRMVGLAETPEEYLQKGFNPGRQASAFAKISAEHGMPIATQERPRMAATVPACRAVVAARLHRPGSERPLLRALRVRHFDGGLLDDEATIDGAAADAGLDPAELRGWMAADDVDEALRADMDAARSPEPAALALDHKLAPWPGGRRYTCPSYVIAAGADGDAETAVVPGFQPMEAYEVALANLRPGLPRRDEPESVEEVLAWAAEPLATKEVAVLCGLELREAREWLGEVADERHVGADGLWTLR